MNIVRILITGWVVCSTTLVWAAPEVTINQGELEVIQSTHTHVVVRSHTKTHEPFVCIVSDKITPQHSEKRNDEKPVARPDYRMLSNTPMAREIHYEGPYSDRTKVYILAGALITTGVATATIAAVAPTAAVAGAGTSAGAGLYTAAGATVGITTLSTALLNARVDTDKEEYTHTSHARLIYFSHK